MTSRYTDVLGVLDAVGDDYGMWGGLVKSLADTGFGVYNAVKQEQDAKAAEAKAAQAVAAAAAKDASLLEAAKSADRRAAETEGTATFLEGVAVASREASARPQAPLTAAKAAAQDAYRASAARQAAAIAAQASATAGIGLSSDGQGKRLEAANALALQKADAASMSANEAAIAPRDVGRAAAASKAAAIASAAALIAARIGGVALAPLPPIQDYGAAVLSQVRSPGRVAVSSDVARRPSAGDGGRIGSGTPEENFLTKKYGPFPGYGWGIAAAVAGVGVKMYLNHCKARSF